MNVANIDEWKRLSFPEKLLYILDSGTQTKIITWLDHGKSFLVVNPDALVRQILCVYFKEVKLSSYDAFEQELHRWGFVKRKLANKEPCTEFRHKKFQRQNKALCKEIRRSLLEANFDGLKRTPNVHGRSLFSHEEVLKDELNRTILEMSSRRRGPSTSSPSFENLYCYEKTMRRMRSIHEKIISVAMRDLKMRQAENEDMQMKINYLSRR